VCSAAAAVCGFVAVKTPSVGYLSAASAAAATVGAASELSSRGPRRITRNAHRRVVEVVSARQLPDLTVTSGAGASEPLILRNQVVTLLRAARCKVAATQSVLAATHEGVAIFYRPELYETAVRLAHILADANVDVSRLQPMSDRLSDPYFFAPEHEWFISVGSTAAV
jgi:hypothetical protein